MVEKTEVVSAETFKSNLMLTKRMVAVLDTWHDPIYLKRVWMIYVQFVASKEEEIDVTFTMPVSANESLKQQISRGEAGIREIVQSVSCIDVQHATAHARVDEIHVKRAIQERDPLGRRAAPFSK
eukprot:g2867.t1